MRTATLWHVTRVRNLRSIRLTGLDPSYATGKRKAVWLVSPWRRAWAVQHVCSRHGCGVEDVCLIPVRVPRAWVKGHLRGTWYCGELIQPELLGAVLAYRPIGV